MYARGFIRNYATYLGLDPSELLKLLRPATRATGSEAARVLDRPLVPLKGAGPLTHVLWGIVLVALVGAIAWLAYQRYYLRVIPWPLNLLPGAQTVAPRVQPSPTLPVILPTPIPTATPEPGPPSVPTEAPTLAPETPPATAITPVVDVAPSPTPLAWAGVTVQAEATGATYLQVRGDGQALFEGTLRPGQVLTWTATTRIALSVGNAGVTSLTVNGVVQPSLGAAGQVVHVEYTANNIPAP